VFEGLLSPWHIVIVAVVLLIVVSPRKVAAGWRALRDSPPRLTGETDDDPGSRDEPAKRSWAFRLGRRLRRR
jgi:Sec-independent protein translocase protein TatA